MFSIKKLFDKEWYFRKEISLLRHFCSEECINQKLYIHKLKNVYFDTFHKRLHLSHPVSLNEKLIWLSLYWRHPLKTECADKVKVRDYVKSKGLSEILVPIIGIYKRASEIQFDELPDSYVLKCNHGCGYNIIVKNKKSINKDAIISQLDKWMAEDYGGGSELHYKNIHPHLIICEQFLCKDVDTEMVDYKIHCINGNPEYIQVCYDRDERGVAHRASYSLDWQPLQYFTEPECKVGRPKSLEKMVEYSKKLSSDFPYVRVDFYDNPEGKDTPVLSELTFTPFGNMIYWVKDEVMEKLGKKLVLPQKYQE